MFNHCRLQQWPGERVSNLVTGTLVVVFNKVEVTPAVLADQPVALIALTGQLVAPAVLAGLVVAPCVSGPVQGLVCVPSFCRSWVGPLILSLKFGQDPTSGLIF